MLQAMASRILVLFAVFLSAYGAPNKQPTPLAKTEQSQKIDEKEDLKSASSSYSHQYSDWRGRYPSGYEFSVTGHGVIDDRVGANYGDAGGYNNVGYGSNPGYSTGYGLNKAYDGYGQSGYDGLGGYSNVNGGYGGTNGYYDGNYIGNSGISGASGYGVYATNRGNTGYGGNGGYGGYGGNGGLSSYYGYKNPYYQGNNHLGYGYYSKRPGYGNIYNNGITPSLVTGYRGYSR